MCVCVRRGYLCLFMGGTSMVGRGACGRKVCVCVCVSDTLTLLKVFAKCDCGVINTHDACNGNNREIGKMDLQLPNKQIPTHYCTSANFQIASTAKRKVTCISFFLFSYLT